MSITHLCLERRSTLALLVFAFWSATAIAQTEKVLHSFAGGTDGASPYAGVVQDAKGDLFGTTYSGGAYGLGTVFEINSAGKETILHSFAGNPDGANPYGGVVLDKKGNLYGTTLTGGSSGCGGSGCGTVFEISSSGQETVLYSFAGPDGESPYAGLTRDAKGNLYGTTYSGGNAGGGVVFEFTPAGEESVLYSFNGEAGYGPYGGLIRDVKGNLYGTSSYSAAYSAGAVFELTSSGTEVLYNFCSLSDCSDGGYPYDSLVRDAEGNLYGTTHAGGSSGSYGTVFKLDTAGKETVLYYFAGGPHGNSPCAGLVRDSKGNLYGTTYYGGSAFSAGLVFEITPKNKEKVLYTFCPKEGCADGANPYAGLIRDANGNLYGTTYAGGSANLGTVYEIVP